MTFIHAELETAYKKAVANGEPNLIRQGYPKSGGDLLLLVRTHGFDECIRTMPEFTDAINELQRRGFPTLN